MLNKSNLQNQKNIYKIFIFCMALIMLFITACTTNPNISLSDDFTKTQIEYTQFNTKNSYIYNDAEDSATYSENCNFAKISQSFTYNSKKYLNFKYQIYGSLSFPFFLSTPTFGIIYDASNFKIGLGSSIAYGYTSKFMFNGNQQKGIGFESYLYPMNIIKAGFKFNGGSIDIFARNRYLYYKPFYGSYLDSNTIDQHYYEISQKINEYGIEFSKNIHNSSIGLVTSASKNSIHIAVNLGYHPMHN